MKKNMVEMIMVGLIAVFALIAAAAGLWVETEGEPYALTSYRGEEVTIYGHGAYKHDTVNSVAQERGNDTITLVVGIPLMLVSAVLAWRGSLRGRLLLTGTLGFFLYTYMSMSMLTAYNQFFLIYVLLFGLSLYAFILSMLKIDLASLPGRFSDRLPRGWIAGSLFVVGGFLALAWLGRVAGEMAPGVIPALENTTTRVIQAMDLVLIVPAAILGGILLLRRSPWGYLLSSVVVLKAITMGLAVSTMVVFQYMAGTGDDPIIAIPFLVITTVNLVMAFLLLKNIKD